MGKLLEALKKIRSKLKRPDGLDEKRAAIKRRQEVADVINARYAHKDISPIAPGAA